MFKNGVCIIIKYLRTKQVFRMKYSKRKYSLYLSELKEANKLNYKYCISGINKLFARLKTIPIY